MPINQLSYNISILNTKFSYKLRLIPLTRCGKPPNLEIFNSIIITNEILSNKNSLKINSPKIKFEKSQNGKIFAEWNYTNKEIKNIIIYYGYYQNGIKWNTLKTNSKIKKLHFSDNLELVSFFKIHFFVQKKI